MAKGRLSDLGVQGGYVDTTFVLDVDGNLLLTHYAGSDQRPQDGLSKSLIGEIRNHPTANMVICTHRGLMETQINVKARISEEVDSDNPAAIHRMVQNAPTSRVKTNLERAVGREVLFVSTPDDFLTRVAGSGFAKISEFEGFLQEHKLLENYADALVGVKRSEAILVEFLKSSAFQAMLPNEEKARDHVSFIQDCLENQIKKGDNGPLSEIVKRCGYLSIEHIDIARWAHHQKNQEAAKNALNQAEHKFDPVLAKTVKNMLPKDQPEIYHLLYRSKVFQYVNIAWARYEALKGNLKPGDKFNLIITDDRLDLLETKIDPKDLPPGCVLHFIHHRPTPNPAKKELPVILNNLAPGFFQKYGKSMMLGMLAVTVGIGILIATGGLAAIPFVAAVVAAATTSPVVAVGIGMGLGAAISGIGSIIGASCKRLFDACFSKKTPKAASIIHLMSAPAPAKADAVAVDAAAVVGEHKETVRSNPNKSPIVGVAAPTAHSTLPPSVEIDAAVPAPVSNSTPATPAVSPTFVNVEPPKEDAAQAPSPPL